MTKIEFDNLSADTLIQINKPENIKEKPVWYISPFSYEDMEPYDKLPTRKDNLRNFGDNWVILIEDPIYGKKHEWNFNLSWLTIVETLVEDTEIIL